MAKALTLAAIEVPRIPQALPGGGYAPPGGWLAGERSVLEYIVRAVLDHLDPEYLTLLTSAPDEDIFRLIDLFGVREAGVGGWLTYASSCAELGGPCDAVAFIRGEVLLRDYSALGKALTAVRELPDVSRVEPAFRPRRQPPGGAFSLVRDDSGFLQPRHFPAPSEQTACACNAFEVHKLRNFCAGFTGRDNADAAAYVWIEEDDIALLQTPLDLLRAELMLG